MDLETETTHRIGIVTPINGKTAIVVILDLEIGKEKNKHSIIKRDSKR